VDSEERGAEKSLVKLKVEGNVKKCEKE